MSDIKNIRDKLDNILNEGLGEMADMVERDHEVQMARSDLYKTAKYAIKLHGMLKNVSEAEGLQGWVQSKITKAADYMGSVQHYMEYEMTPPDMQLALAQTESEMNEEKMKMVKGPDGKMVPSFAADGKGKNDLKKKVDVTEEKVTEGFKIRDKSRGYGVSDKTYKTREEAETAAMLKRAQTGGNWEVIEEGITLEDYDPENSYLKLKMMQKVVLGLGRSVEDLYNNDNGDLQDQIQTMTKLVSQFEDVIKRAYRILPLDFNESVIKEKDTIDSIIAKLPRDNAEKGSDSSFRKKKDMGSMQDIIDRLPKDNDEAVPDIMSDRMIDKGRDRLMPDRDPGTFMDKGPRTKMYLPVAKPGTFMDKGPDIMPAMKNKKKMRPESKFSDWSKK